jgi:hypothetical protein
MRDSGSGASRTRTGDLLGAIQERTIANPASEANFSPFQSTTSLGYPAIIRGFWGWDELHPQNDEHASRAAAELVTEGRGFKSRPRYSQEAPANAWVLRFCLSDEAGECAFELRVNALAEPLHGEGFFLTATRSPSCLRVAVRSPRSRRHVGRSR